MKSRWSSEQLDTLLGRGGIGAARREAILEQVLSQVRAERPAPRRWRWPLAGLGIAAVAAALVLLVPRMSPQDSSAFRAKGGQTSKDHPSAALECLGASPQACPLGSLLLVQASGTSGYLSAWAHPRGGGVRIWYFSAETSSPQLDGRPLPPENRQRAVRIGTEHAPGSYDVEIRVTKLPMTREQLLKADDQTVLVTARVPLTVVAPR